MDEKHLQALREALAATPDNVPLRRHLAETLVGMARFDDAIVEYREALKRAPRDETLKLALAELFERAGKRSEALVLVEDLIAHAASPGPAYLLQARIRLAEGDVDGAGRAYQKAIDEDPGLADAELAGELGLTGWSEGGDEVDEQGRIRIGHDASEGPAIVPMEKPDLDFDGVGGMEELKERIRMKVVHPLQHADLFAAYGKKVGGGVLLYGPPGCGKTHIARATAGEIDASFIPVGIHDVLDMWLGNSEKRLHELFEAARKHTPCVLFFDEVDALGAKRSAMSSSAARSAINQFLAEMDGIQARNDGLLVLAATNAPWNLDPAFRRPGRFTNQVFVPPPDAESRAAILQLHLAGKPLADVDADKVARRCEGFSGADLQGLVEAAVEIKLEEAMRTGKPEPLRTKDLLAAAKKVRPTTKEWFATARDHVLFADVGGVYDELRPYLDL